MPDAPVIHKTSFYPSSLIDCVKFSVELLYQSLDVAQLDEHIHSSESENHAAVLMTREIVTQWMSTATLRLKFQKPTKFSAALLTLTLTTSNGKTLLR